MGRAPCCSKVGLHRGPWTPHEDSLLINYIQTHGEGLWRSLPKKAGLLRCGKSCRLRWLNYLRPDIKRGNISQDEDELIIKLHALLGNKWSLIAGRLPGRTDNEIKNYWNTHLSKKLRSEGTDPSTHKKLCELVPVPPKRKRSSPKRRENKEIPTYIHFPKPVRVTSMMSSLKRDSSVASFESHVTNVSGLTSDGSGGAAEPAYWPKSYDYDGVELMMEENDGGGLRFMIGCEGVTEHAHASDLDKLYEEYLQLLKSDDDHDHNLARELDSFAESLLI
ncbi:hypothetical protein V2J09_013936 [Rumex salicifolius]